MSPIRETMPTVDITQHIQALPVLDMDEVYRLQDMARELRILRGYPSRLHLVADAMARDRLVMSGKMTRDGEVTHAGLVHLIWAAKNNITPMRY